MDQINTTKSSIPENKQIQFLHILCIYIADNKYLVSFCYRYSPVLALIILVKEGGHLRISKFHADFLDMFGKHSNIFVFSGTNLTSYLIMEERTLLFAYNVIAIPELLLVPNKEFISTS